MRKRWSFTWCDRDAPPTNGDAHDWKTKQFRVGSLAKALDLMLDYIRDKPHADYGVDYEVAAEHVVYDGSNHDEVFHRIPSEHPLHEYVS